MQIDISTRPLTSLSGTSGLDPLAESEAKRKARFEELLAEEKEAAAMLEDVTKGGVKGYWEWKIEEMRKAITAQVMGEMNVTPEKLAAMPVEERLALEEKIKQIVEDRLKLAVTEEMKKKKMAETEAFGTILTATQEFTGAL